MKKFAFLGKKYLPDILILLGVVIFSYNMFLPHEHSCLGLCNRFNGLGEFTDYHIIGKVIGIFILTLAIIIAVRRFRSKK